MLTELSIEEAVRDYLLAKKWEIEKPLKQRGEHGCDIIASHSKWRKKYFIEVKGSGKAAIQMKHNGFYMLIGQIVSRMDIGGNNPNKSRFYAIAIPAEWEQTFKNKIQKMKYGWRLLKLKVFLVDDNSRVIEKSYTKFL